MCGGGGSSAPDPVDPMKTAEAEIKVLQQQYAMEQQQLEQQLQREREQELQDRAAFDQRVVANRGTARQGIDTAFQNAGLNSADYNDRIIAALNQAQSGMTYDTGNTAFSADIGSNLLDQMRNEQIREYQRNVNEWAPEGFEQEAFASSADDAVISAILGEQFGTASDSILRARDRGTLNDQGFDYAMANLEQQRKAASSRLDDIGGGILEGYRGELSGIADNARTGAGSWDFGSSYNPATYGQQLQKRQGELSGSLEGDIRNAIGGEQFFNTNDLIQKGGIGQGAQNTGLGAQSGSLLNAITDRKKAEQEQRGLGTQGSF